MKKPKSKDAQIEERRNRIVELLRERKPYSQISKELGVSVGTICGDCKVIWADWRQMRVTNSDDTAMTELARLAFVIEEALKQWEISKDRKRTKLKYSAQKIGEDGNPLPTMASENGAIFWTGRRCSGGRVRGHFYVSGPGRARRRRCERLHHGRWIVRQDQRGEWDRHDADYGHQLESDAEAIHRGAEDRNYGHQHRQIA